MTLGSAGTRHSPSKLSPADIGAAFRTLGQDTRDMLSDGARDYGKPLQRIVSRARARLATLPREQAARAALELRGVEWELDEDNDKARRASFLEDVTGDEARALAQVDLLADGDAERRCRHWTPSRARIPATNAAAKALYQKGFDLAHNGMVRADRRRGSD